MSTDSKLDDRTQVELELSIVVNGNARPLAIGRAVHHRRTPDRR